MANTLDAELEGTGVVAFTIGPGLVPTNTATEAIELVAPKLGMTVDEFWSMNAGAVMSVEAAVCRTPTCVNSNPAPGAGQA